MKHVRDQLEVGVIGQVNRAWEIPVVIARKKDVKPERQEQDGGQLTETQPYPTHAEDPDPLP